MWCCSITFRDKSNPTLFVKNFLLRLIPAFIFPNIRYWLFLLSYNTLFEHSCIFNRISGPGLGFKAGPGYWFAGTFTDTISFIFYTLQRIVNFPQQLPFAIHQSQSEFLLVVICSDISHMDRHT